MTQDNGWDVPDENYRLYRAFQGVAKLIAAAEFRDAYLMAAALRDEFRSRCANPDVDVYAPKATSSVDSKQTEVQRRWAARNPLNGAPKC